MLSMRILSLSSRNFRRCRFNSIKSNWFTESHSSNEEGDFTFSSSSFYHLKSRGLVSVFGKDAQSFLQSLMTNNINILDCDATKSNIKTHNKEVKFNKKRISLGCVFLNHKGRVMFDAIVTRSHL